MHLIGILGGVASGKSLVSQMLVDLGAGWLDADRAGHEVLRMPHIEAAARQRWGERVFDADGRIDRPRLAEIVFAHPEQPTAERRYLEQLTHDEIAVRLRQQADTLSEGGCVAAVLDAPLLLEAGWDKLCRWLVFVAAPRSQRLMRAVGRGWSEEGFSAREAAQESLDRKRGRADVTIDNSGSTAATRAQLEQFWRSHLG